MNVTRLSQLANIQDVDFACIFQKPFVDMPGGEINVRIDAGRLVVMFFHTSSVGMDVFHTRVTRKRHGLPIYELVTASLNPLWSTL